MFYTWMSMVELYFEHFRRLTEMGSVPESTLYFLEAPNLYQS